MFKDCGKMLVKVRLGDVQKVVRITEPNLSDFLNAAFAKLGVPAVTEGVKVVDSSGTEIDDDVFEEIVKDPSTGVLTIKYETESVSMVTSPKSQSSVCSSDSDTIILEDTPTRKRQRLDSEAMQLVKSILTKKSGGEYIINKYNRTKSLTDESRRKLVNILAAEMTEKNGTSPSRQVKEMYAQGIVKSCSPTSETHFPRMAMNIFMIATVVLGTWPGELKLFRDAVLKKGSHHLELWRKDHLMKTSREDQLLDKLPNSFQRLSCLKMSARKRCH
ncbi:uncharacterized protein LOC133662807 isoform X1 [Entelurus aequoreus]|uniref:uncharacterized protein LOC133662807 isoform X1 n=1 Tax=Entelurus aequoreus TaxID=161455 RepID=UPI002B1E5FC4|nr:uncharacterized protein LOC133662807 isoform X1 [Entelurus aequoreus]